MAYDGMTDPKTWVAGNTLTAAELNTYLRDNQDAMFPSGDGWEDWTPSYSNFTVGNGTVEARYIQAGKLVVCHFTWTFGSTSSIDGAAATVSAPVTAASEYTANNSVGNSHFFESGGSTYPGNVRLQTTTTLRPIVWNAASTYVVEAGITSSAPFTWGTNDILMFTATYEAA